MTQFEFHTPQTAPEAARPLLEGARAKLGFVPSLYAGLAEAPTALQAYLMLADLLSRSSLTPTEQQVVALTASAENGCDFCMAAHSTIARNMVKVNGAIVDALRAQRPLPNTQLEALRTFVLAIVRERGRVRGAALDAFLEVGYTRQQALDVILGVAMKTLSNYANHLLETPIDAPFLAESWPPAA